MAATRFSGSMTPNSDLTKSRPKSRFRFCAPGVVIESISSRLCAIRRQYKAEYGNEEHSEGARGQTGSRNMAATRFFDSVTATSYLTSNTSQCLSHTVTQFYSVNIKSRPKYTTISGFVNPLQV